MGRGSLTEEVKRISIEQFGYEFSKTELRLLPYIQYTMMNEQRIDPNKINKEEREILSKWRSKGWIGGGASGLEVTKDFWDQMNEVLWHSYVNYEVD